MHTVELLPDEELSSGIRELWDRLRAAGLPSLANHQHPTNRPHLTVVTAPSLDGLTRPAPPASASGAPVGPAGDGPARGAAPGGPPPGWPVRGLLPLAAELGPVRLLGRTLVREVVVTPALRDLHALIWRVLQDAWPPPTDWVPHLSLALRVPIRDHPVASGLLAGLPPARGQFVAARTYDTETRIATDL
jgi:hypothetical protein